MAPTPTRLALPAVASASLNRRWALSVSPRNIRAIPRYTVAWPKALSSCSAGQGDGLLRPPAPLRAGLTDGPRPSWSPTGPSPGPVQRVGTGERRTTQHMIGQPAASSGQVLQRKACPYRHHMSKIADAATATEVSTAIDPLPASTRLVSMSTANVAVLSTPTPPGRPSTTPC
jgi:hypothetical protein